jgi:hypothetical protein
MTYGKPREEVEAEIRRKFAQPSRPAIAPDLNAVQ